MFLPRRLVIQKRPLVAVASQSIDDRSSQIWLKHSGASKLTNLLGRFANGQVASSTLAMLDLASSCQSETFLGRFMCLLFGHGKANLTAGRASGFEPSSNSNQWGQKCSRNWAGIQGEKRGFLGIGSGAFQTAICPSGSALEFSLFSRLGRIVTGVEPPADFVPKNQEKPRPKAVLGRLWIKNTA